MPFERPTLRFAFGRADVAEGVCLSPTVFRISLRADGAGSYLAHEQVLTDRGGRWVDGEIPLTSWAGQQVEVSFEAWPETVPDSRCEAPVAVVGDVRVVAGGADPRPDLWVIVIDAWRADHASYLADGAPPTPRIDALASEAHRFTDAAAPAPWTRESVFALMTGSYATAAIPGTRDSAQFSLGDTVPTIPERVGASGYRTLAVYANAVLAPDNGLERGFDAYAFARGDGDLPEAVETLRAAADPRRPRLIYAHLISPHVPYCQHEQITDRHLRAAGVPPPWPDCVGELAETRGRAVSEDERRTIRAFYRGEVEFADWVTGRLL
ncbi:MAG: sulfatase-like hydrolase/transferase, partial [Myxococcota bacterium]|nr:sulfatase-like hydrolase/transferase [Myxococcota bacterium]